MRLKCCIPRLDGLVGRRCRHRSYLCVCLERSVGTGGQPPDNREPQGIRDRKRRPSIHRSLPDPSLGPNLPRTGEEQLASRHGFYRPRGSERLASRNTRATGAPVISEKWFAAGATRRPLHDWGSEEDLECQDHLASMDQCRLGQLCHQL